MSVSTTERSIAYIHKVDKASTLEATPNRATNTSTDLDTVEYNLFDYEKYNIVAK